MQIEIDMNGNLLFTLFIILVHNEMLILVKGDFCEGKAIGNYPHPDCTKFYSCADSGTHVMDCQAGLLYNSKTDQCDWPTNVVCTQIETFSCKDRPYGNYPNPDCTKFYSCAANGKHVMDCPAGLHFNPKTDQCDWPANAQCEK
ncbi:CHI10-like protein [Mya arenaria]|uniref:CHI10-like protein n=1 Tax=Mya arenaria TaxID=6604 RepID=A0ABY7EZW7_MYAAR|nr:chondroitin proteoglycan 2-like [Mya arenaria]WAR15472.1 CHI10-like protein [Mya arenaria]